MAIDNSKVRTVFDSVNMASTKYAERIFDCVCDEDVENGTFGYMGELVDRNMYKFVKGTKAGEKVLVVDQPVWDEDESSVLNQRRKYFYIPAGTPFRARVVKINDEFGITIEGVSAATQEAVTGVTDFMANDVFLTVGDDGKLVASDAAAEGAIMEARVERKRLLGAKLVTPLRQYGSDNFMYEARIKVLA